MTVKELEAVYRAAQAELSTEFMRFCHTKSANYGPDRLTALSIQAKKARNAFLNAKFGYRDRTRD